MADMLLLTTRELWIICLVFTSCIVDSAKINGIINRKYDVALTEDIYSSDLSELSVNELTLNKLLYPRTLPALAISNVRLNSLIISDILLESVPIFRNVSIYGKLKINGSQIRTVFSNAFNIPNPKKIFMTNGDLEMVEDRAFNEELQVLHLRCNKLSVFSDSWFQKVETIEVLHLSGNRIQHLQDHAFNLMTGLNDLNLMHNHIIRIGKAAFGSSLTLLNLSFNNISQLPTSVFSTNNVTVKFFYIDYNRLGFLTDQLLDVLNVNEMSIDGNPWQCPCLRNIEKWIRAKNVVRSYLSIARDQQVCVVARNFHDVCVLHVDSELQELYMSSLAPIQHCLLCGTCSGDWYRHTIHHS